MPPPGNKSKANAIPQATIEALSRTIYKEASDYGFGQVEIIKLINHLMDHCANGVASELCISDRNDTNADCNPHDFDSLPLTASSLRIRQYDATTDRALLESWLPDKYGRYFVLSCSTAQEVTVKALSESPANHLGIIEYEDGTAVGAMAYLDHSRSQKRAELRKLVGNPEFRGRGIAEEATRLWVNYGIHGLGLRKIYVSTLQTQIANIRLNESIGFQVEGLLRNEVLIDNERHDVLRMGLSIEVEK
tara:strand:- start:8738 stop:9481 length:744 start_codon:yes stop_codon:yes gene_type:complete